MSKLNVSIAGASGYTGGELLRILLSHPHVQILQVTSEKNAGKYVYKIHPNLRKSTMLKFCTIDELTPCDVLFLCLPHGETMHRIHEFLKLSPRIIDLSSDFRLNNSIDYKTWYDVEHPHPELLDQFVYGIPELHRDQMRQAQYISSAGCNATAAILPLYPLFKENIIAPQHTIIEVKASTSEAGHHPNPGSHHPERSGSIRAYKPYGHRHTAEILQELNPGENITAHLTVTALDRVRGIQAVCHTFLNTDTDEKTLWKTYRSTYGNEPFIRIINERDGIHRLPDPKILLGSNFCDIGFAKDPTSNRLIVYSALDNLVKGAAGQAVQALNIMNHWDETTALTFPGLHPV